MLYKTFNMQEYYANEKSVLNSPYELCIAKCVTSSWKVILISGTPLALICYVQ